MKSFFLYSLAAIALALSGCSAASNVSGTTIEGTVSDGGGLKVFLDKARPNNQTMVLSQADTDGSGAFSMNLEDGIEPGIYRLRLGAKKVFLVFDGTEKVVTINGDLGSMDRYDYSITGSPASEEFRQGMSDLVTRKMDVQGMTEFIANAKEPYVAVQFAIVTLQNSTDFMELHKTALQNAEAKYQNTEIVNDYRALIAGLERAYAQRMSRERIQVGQPAPEISMKDPEGKQYNLSDLNGKVVLVDFWASWCGPCRKANPHVVEVYDKYNEKGFTVFSVSLDGLDSRSRAKVGDQSQLEPRLDASKKAWLAAIQKDNLKWEYHVSDLEKWDTRAAKEYGVTGIPKTFLIDRDGNIAAINPRYNLEEAILKVL